jgi:hypothetical protein
MPPVVYVDEAVDFEGEGCSCVESVESVESVGGSGNSDGGGCALTSGIVGREGWEGGGG